MKNYFTKVITITLFLLLGFQMAFAGRGDKTKSIYTPEGGGSPVIIETSTAIDSVKLDPLGSNQRDYNVTNRISFGVDLHYPEYVASHQLVEVAINVQSFDENNNVLPESNFKLKIDYYHQDTLNSTVLDKYEFNDAYKMIFQIDTIFVNGNITDTLPKNLYLKSDIFVERYTSLATTLIVPNTPNFIDKDCDGTSDGIHFSWLPHTGAEEYQLEFMHVSNYGASGSTIPPSSLNFDFKHNSTRVTTSELEVSIGLIFDRGWVAFRVRPVGVNIDSLTNYIYGEWSSVNSGTIDNISERIEITSNEIHETALNWQYSATYAEQGKRKEVITYYDGTLRNRQAVTRTNSNNNVVVGETIYDYQGRPTVTVLPTPVESPACSLDAVPTIKFYPSFNKNIQGETYSKKDFDLSPTDNCAISAEGMSTTSGASQYYSSSNPDQELQQAYVPDAEKYPFQQVEYTPDNTGRISREGGVGPDFQLGSDKETRYIYANPNQLELNRMFGSEVGNSEHYKKNIVIDANGQASISYLDLRDEVIATALAGASPENLDSIGNSDKESIESNLIHSDGSNQVIDYSTNTVTLSTSIPITSSSNVKIKYELINFPLEDTCVENICVDCIYDLKISLKDDCGENLLSGFIDDTIVGNFEIDSTGKYVFMPQCEDSTIFNADTSLYLGIGKYTLFKELSINENAVKSYLELIDSSDCVLNYDEFLDEEMAGVDTAACVITCDDCLDDLGSLQNFISSGQGSSADYHLRVQECKELCVEKVSDCEMYFSIMQIDMAPGGQYAEYLNDQGETNIGSFPLSVLNSNNHLPNSSAYWRNPTLTTAYGTENIYVDENGERSRIYLIEDDSTASGYYPEPNNANAVHYDPVEDKHFIYPEDLLSVDVFIDRFKLSWSKSLVKYHPEYCYYESCIQNEQKKHESDAFSSTSFDDLLKSTQSFAQAKAFGFIDQNTNKPTDWTFPVGNNPNASIKPWDPFVFYKSDFKTEDCQGFIDDLESKVAHYKFKNGSWFSMAQIAAYTIRCGANFPSNPQSDCFSFGQDYNNVHDTVILNKEWTVLKALYMGAKQEAQQELAKCKAIMECNSYNGCIGEKSHNLGKAYLDLFGFSQGWPQTFFNFYLKLALNTDQPCSIFNEKYYKYKIKRFVDHDDAKKKKPNNIAYEMYLQTGQCPNAFNLQYLLDELVKGENLTTSPFDLNSTNYLSALFQGNNGFTNPGPLPDLTYSITSNTSSVITADWLDANNTVFATLTLNNSSGEAWSDIIEITNLSATGNHSFTAEAKYMEMSDTTLQQFEISGTLSNFNLDDCTFEQECKTNQLAVDLTTAFNALAADGNINMNSPIDITDYNSGGWNDPIDLTTLYIINAANSGGQLSIDQTNDGFRIYNTSIQGNDGLYIGFTNINGVLNTTDIYFETMQPTGDYSFDWQVNKLTGAPVMLHGIMYRIHDGDTLGISAGNCDLPTPIKCQGLAYEVFNDFQPLLEDVLTHYDGQSDIDLYSSIHTTVAIVETLPYDEEQTTSTVSGDSLIISAGDCDVALSLTPSQYIQFTNIESIDELELMGDINFDGGYNDFYAIASFETPSGNVQDTIYGSTCFTLKDCFPCANVSTDSDSTQFVGFSYTSSTQSAVVKSYAPIPSYSTSSSMMPLVNQKCVEAANIFNISISWFNAHYHLPITIPFFTPEQMEQNGWCDCADDFKQGLTVIIEHEMIFNHWTNIMEYLTDKYNCKDCSEKYEDYMNLINEFEDDYTGPFEFKPNDILTYASFSGTYKCECLYRYHNLLDSILVNNIQFDSQEDFSYFIKYGRICLGCPDRYNWYRASVENYNANTNTYTVSPINELMFVAYDYCNCVSRYDSLLQVILTTNKQFPTEEDFLDYVDLNTICNTNPCELNYQYYLDCINDFNTNYNGGYAIFGEDVIEYNYFKALKCQCVASYCNLLDSMVTQNIQFTSQEEFSKFINFGRNCKKCPRAYERYKEVINKYNSLTTTFTLSPMSEELFAANGYCDCIDAFALMLSEIIDQNIQFNSESEFLIYTNMYTLCNGSDMNEPEDPCEEAYEQYLNCNLNLLSKFKGGDKVIDTLQWPFKLKYITYETFIDSNLCTCVDAYCSALDEIIAGLVTFSSQEDFDNYIFSALDCNRKPPCQGKPSTGMPEPMPTVDLENDCIETQVNLAQINAQNAYNQYLDEIHTIYREKYISHCLETQEKLFNKYDDGQYHYTLYYYDQAGNLIKTVPPEGVELLDIDSSEDDLNIKINNDRDNGTKTVFTSHRLQTRYEYNSLNQLVAQYTPDTDPMNAFEVVLPNGLNADLITRKIQMVNASLGYLAGEVGNRGYLYKTTDGGQTWQRLTDIVAADLKKVEMINSNLGIAIGEAGTVLKTNDGGNTWDIINTWGTIEMITTLNDIAVDPVSGDIMVVGNNGLTAKFTDFNTNSPSFTVINNNFTDDVIGVTSYMNDFYFTTYNSSDDISRFYKYSSNSWSEIDKIRNNGFTSLDYYAIDKAYAADDDGRIYSNKQVSNSSSKWVHQSSDLKSKIKTIRFFDEKQGVALVKEDDGKFYLYRTIDTAKTWSKLSYNSYNALDISTDHSIMVAGGDDGEVSIVYPYVSGDDQVADINVPSIGDVLEVWIGKTSNGTIKILVADDQKVWFTKNALLQNPIWDSIGYSTLSNNSLIVELTASSVPSGNLYGVAIAASGEAWKIKNETGLAIQFGGSLGSNYKRAVTNDSYFYLTTGSSTLVRSQINGTNNIVNFGSTNFIGNVMSMRLGNIVLSDQNSELSFLNVGVSGISSTTNYKESIYPDKINVLDVDQIESKMYAFGNDGLVYRYDNNFGHFNRLKNPVNKNIYGVDVDANNLFIVGEKGMAKVGTANTNNVIMDDLNVSPSQTVASNFSNLDLKGVKYTSNNRLYLVGENGALFYNQNFTSTNDNLTKVAQSNINFHGITDISGTNNVLIVGDNAHIQAQYGAMSINNTHIYIPPIKDVHFKDAGFGTLIADNYTARRTSNGGSSWKIVAPQSNTVPPMDYDKVWTLDNQRSLLLGNGDALLYNNASNSTSLAFTATNVLAVSERVNTQNIYIVDDTKVKEINTSTLNVSPVISNNDLSQAHDIHVFSNGDFMVVGENDYYEHYDSFGTSITSANNGLPSSIDFNAITFNDHIRGIVVGDDGTYYRTINPNVSNSGYLQGVSWKEIDVTQNDPQGITDADIFTVDFASSVDILIGGENMSTPNTPSPYVRKIYDDGGRYSSRFYYDKLGRLIISQNGRQKDEDKFSYTLYDDLGRVVEVGEKTENPSNQVNFEDIFGAQVSGYFNPSSINDQALNDWIEGDGSRKEVTKSYYDIIQISGLPAVMTSNYTTQRLRITSVAYEEDYDGDKQTYDHATHYRYDIHGNVETLIQDNKKMETNFPSLASQEFKQLDYDYDLISGNVNRMSVQNGEEDQWHHAYTYDADNRIKNVYTNTGIPLTSIDAFTQDKQNELTVNSDWQNDAQYYYYDHGPLARVEIGQNQLQGVDYYYNLQGWLKGVNSSVLNQENDPGNDSDPNSIDAYFGKDVYGFGLHYYNGDYSAIGGGTPQTTINNSSHASDNSFDLYNGNIRFMETTITNPHTRDSMPMLNAYKYDQLNRLKESRSYEKGLNSNNWNPTGYNNEYFNTFAYDAMGNIKNQNRHLRDGTQIDEMSYHYQEDDDDNLLRNRLYQITDMVDATVDSTDIDDMGPFYTDPDSINVAHNYSYDAEGRLVKDRQEEIDTIIWTVNGKVKEIRRTLGSNKKNLTFDYDAMGNRIAKHVYNNQTEMLEKSTYYILDAQGNQLSMYEHQVDNEATMYYLSERNIYGSSRMGTLKDTVNMFIPTTLPSYGVVGNRNYELTNHLGNVLTVINDIVYPLSEDSSSIDSYEVGISNVFDYSPFGVQLDGRTIENKIYSTPVDTSSSPSPPTPTPDEIEIYKNKFDSPPATSSPYTGTPSTLASHLSTTGWTSSTGGFFNTTGASGKAIGISSSNADTTYVTLTMDVESGYELDVTSYSFYHLRGSFGYRNYKLMINSVEVGSGSLNYNSNNLYVNTGEVNVAQPITELTGTVTVVFKLYGVNKIVHPPSPVPFISVIQNRVFKMDDFILNGFTKEEGSTSQDGKGGYVMSNGYRYGFNGMERDDNVKGEGNSYDFGARLYDPRVGRWLSIDALEGKKPHLSPYQAFKNSPLIYNDPDGNDEYLTIVMDDKRTGRKTTIELQTAVSTKIRTDWKAKNDGTSFASYNYYDYKKTITMTIDEEGKKSIDTQSKIIYENGVKDNDFVGQNYSPKPKPDLMYTLFNSNLEGEGGSQKGGLRLTTEEGGVSTTKYVAENDVKSISIGSLLAAFGAKGTSMSKPSEIEEGVEIISELYKEVANLTTRVEGGEKTKEKLYECPTCSHPFSAKDTLEHNIDQERESGPYKEIKD